MTLVTVIAVSNFTRTLYLFPHVNDLLLLTVPAPSACANPPPHKMSALNKGTTFELTINTTFDKYKLAFNSGRVPLALLLPPQYCNIHI
jgi:hypothetical protein